MSNRAYTTEEEQLKMFEEMEKALTEHGYEFEYRDNLMFTENMFEAAWAIEKSIFVNASLFNQDNEDEDDFENGMLYIIQIYDKNGYRFIPNLFMERDPDVEGIFKYKSWTPTTAEDTVDFIKKYDNRFKELERTKLEELGIV
ncbi:hypothetical protein [Guptibacillus hwajinpoensis]|uniref:hypothetical protein n=1 Tax=Guptibacillus hwajinpoensis TaxID=208199 RepID=UPI003CFBF19F